MQRDAVDLRDLRVAGQCNVDAMRHLRGQAMVSQGGDQADDRLRNSKRNGYQVRAGKKRRGREPVKTASDSFEFAAVPEGLQRSRVNAKLHHLARAQHAAVFAEHVAGFGESCIGRGHLDRTCG